MWLPKLRELREAIKALIKGPYTANFPQEPHVPYPSFRGLPKFNQDRCVGCLACEQVCPVAATVHGETGLNEMVYNRCIGTRYCANNCPYKVRRFNFFLYSDFATESMKLSRNPDVTVRSRGVMEKCSMCIQRIQEGRLQAKNEGRALKDGEIQMAEAASVPSSSSSLRNLVQLASFQATNWAMAASPARPGWGRACGIGLNRALSRMFTPGPAQMEWA